jgi:hypothetical protein
MALKAERRILAIDRHFNVMAAMADCWPRRIATAPEEYRRAKIEDRGLFTISILDPLL